MAPYETLIRGLQADEDTMECVVSKPGFDAVATSCCGLDDLSDPWR